jgi:glycosyltransferase involved in cell wall biosynthesis
VRIAIITETWLPSVDGVVTRLRHTVRHLAASGHDVLVLAPSTGPPAARTRQVELPGLVLPFIDRRRRIGLPMPDRVTGPVDRFDPDVIHVVNPVLMGTAAMQALAGRHSTVVSFHTDLSAYAARYHLGVLRPLLRSMMRAAYRRADVAMATSPAGQRQLGELGVNARLWPPAVDTDIFRPGPAAADPPDWLSDEPSLPTALWVGRLAPEKSLDLLAPVLAAARSGSRPWHLTIIGDGPDRSRLERRFDGLPVTFTGTRTASDVAVAYRSADVLLMPSTTETVGLVLLEAAACGLPLVAADTPAVRYTTRDTAAQLLPLNATPQRWARAVADTLARPRPAPTKIAGWREVTSDLIEAYRWVEQLH